MKKEIFLTLISLITCIIVNGQADWTNWVKLNNGEVYCRIQKIIPSKKYGSSYFDINIQYKVKNQWLKTKADATSSMEVSNAYFLDNGKPVNDLVVYINKLPNEEYFYFEGKVTGIGSSSKYFEANFYLHKILENDFICSTKIPL